jgi:hypothetical protein
LSVAITLMLLIQSLHSCQFLAEITPMIPLAC